MFVAWKQNYTGINYESDKFVGTGLRDKGLRRREPVTDSVGSSVGSRQDWCRIPLRASLVPAYAPPARVSAPNL